MYMNNEIKHVSLIHFLHNHFATEHPRFGTIVEKRFSYKHLLLVHAVPETKTWRFYFEHVTSGLSFYILY